MYQAIIDHHHRFFSEPQPEPRRVFHGRGHMFEGLEHINVDWYPPVLLVTGYQPIEAVESLGDSLIACDQLGQVATVIYQLRASQGATSKLLWGESRSETIVEENGIRYEVQPGVNQNAGFFLDMRPLREWLKRYSKGRNVLNLFSYTCSLSVAALDGDARQVVSVDMSKPSIQWGVRNHELNGHELRKVRSMSHNVFKSWGRITQYGPYNTIIIDPPTLQRGSFNAEKDYVAILKKLSKLAAPEADVIASVNSPYLGADFLPNLMQRHQSKFRLVGDFPVSPEFIDRYPERGLKLYHYKSPRS